MSDITKRLDLQFGPFACSVQGFDDPVQPVQQVLQALQSMLEESPEIGDSVLSFDAEAIERLIGEVARRADLQEKNVEIVPGLIIVQRGDAAEGTEAFDRALDGADDGDRDGDGEAWARPFVGGYNDTGGADSFGTEPGETKADHTPEAAENAEAGFVNIFTPAAHSDSDIGDTGDTGADSASGMFMTAADDTSERAGDDAAREGEPVRDIFGDPEDVADGDAGGSVFADPMAENTGWEPMDEGEPVNFFAAADRTDEGIDGTDRAIGDEPGASENLFASAEPEDSGEELVLAPGDGESERGEALFGTSDDQPEVEEADDGYTPGGLAQTAGAETVADLMVSAAAWMVLIQGKTTFTRHDVIDVFKGMPGEHSKTLEARIKGFGKAVRNDQLIMIEDGVFGLSRKELERFQRLL